MKYILQWILMALFLGMSQESIASVMKAVSIPARGNQPTVVAPSGKAASLYSQSAALLISVSKYPGGASGWHPLPSTGKELDAVAEKLVSQGFSVTRISDPDRDEIIEEMQKFLEKYGADEKARLVFFYSGHGFTDSRNQLGYIVPLGAGNPGSNRSRFLARSISLEHFSSWVRQFSARHFLLMFDSCFSGSVFTTKSISKQVSQRPVDFEGRWRYLVGASEKSARQFVSAGGPDEVLPASSVFVDLFLRGIAGQASSVSDGYVTGRELGVFLEQNVNAIRAGKQNPISGFPSDLNSSAGDIVFQYRPLDSDREFDRKSSLGAVDGAPKMQAVPPVIEPASKKLHDERIHSLKMVMAAVDGKIFSDHAAALRTVNTIVPDDLSGDEVASILGETAFSYRRSSLEILLTKVRPRSVPGRSVARIVGSESFSDRVALISMLEPYIASKITESEMVDILGDLGYGDRSVAIGKLSALVERPVSIEGLKLILDGVYESSKPNLILMLSR